MIKKALIFCIVLPITACSLKSNPVSVDARYTEAQQDVKELFDPQKAIPKKLTYYEALARSIKYNLDYRIKLTNYALQAGQLNVAEFTMFPALNTSGSLYTRNNNMSSFGTTQAGGITDVLNSTPRTLRSARIGLSWNVLDFGLGYVRAKEQSERILIAEEESRKQVQTLAQDVLVAYWSAYNAQQLLNSTRSFQRLLNNSKKMLELAVVDKTIPQENILNYQAALLDGNRRLIQLQYKYDKAMLDLRHLMDLPPDQQLVLSAPPRGLSQSQNLNHLNFKKLDAITLVSRPELRSQDYQKSIAEFGVKLAILQSLPGVTLNSGWNYNSNKFLINRMWVDRSMDLAWNLLNLASLPTTIKTAKIQVKYEKLKRMALTIAALTETRYAYWHYQTLSAEYSIAHKQTQNAEALYALNRNREIASLASRQQVVLANLKVLTSKMDESLLLSDLSTALGELYLSTGSDILPIDVEGQSISELTLSIENNFAFHDVLNFHQFIDHTYVRLFQKPVMQKPKAKPTAMCPITKVIAAKNNQPKPALITKISVHNKSQLVKVSSMQSYTIQVLGSYSLADVLNLQTRLPAAQISMHGQTKNHHKDWYILTIGQYKTAKLANLELKSLPASIKKSAAWVRSTKDITWLN